MHARREAMVLANYETEAGEIRDVDLTLVDAGYRTEAVYDACRDLGLGFRPYMGFGKSQRMRQDELHRTAQAHGGQEVRRSGSFPAQPRGIWLVAAMRTSGSPGNTIAG